MKQSFILSLLVVLAMSMMLGCKKQDKDQPSPDMPIFTKEGILQVIGSDGKVKATLDIEIAETQDELRQGLKNRELMEDNQGMLFIMDGQTKHPFWMQDTYLSLDMIFVEQDKTIFEVVENTTPFSEEMIEPKMINMYTLEIRAGMAKKYNITAGDRLEWKTVQ